MSAVANFTTRHGFWSILGKNTAFCVYLVHVKYWCAAKSNLAYFIELTTTLECQKQLLMSSISNLGGRESREIAVFLERGYPGIVAPFRSISLGRTGVG